MNKKLTLSIPIFIAIIVSVIVATIIMNQNPNPLSETSQSTNNAEIINIHGSKNVESINMIDTFIDIIIEFLKERIPYMISKLNININNDSCDILAIKQSSSNICNINKINYYWRRFSRK